MLACVYTYASSTVVKWYQVYITMYGKKYVFLEICTLFSGNRHGYFLALSAAGHAGIPPVHHGARLGPGRAPWRVF